MLRIICLLVSFLIFLPVIAQETSQEQDPQLVSGAESIIRFQKFISSDHQRLIQMKSRSAKLAAEIEELTREFERIDSQLENLTETDGTSTGNEKLDQVLNSLDLHLRSRQAILQQITIVQNKIEKQQEIVSYITIGEVPLSEDSLKLTLSNADTTAQTITKSEKQSRKELAALHYLQMMEAELSHAGGNLLIMDQLIRINKADLELARSLSESSSGLLEHLGKQTQDSEVRRHKQEATRRLSQDTILIAKLKSRIIALESFREPLIEAMSEAEDNVKSARSELEFLQSAIAPYRVLHWLQSTLPTIAIILLVFFMIWVAGRWIIKIILNKIIKNSKDVESADRLETLKLASGSIITILVVFGGFVVLLSEIGIDLTVVLGGAAVLSLVIAFGAQSLVKDYLSGFMILLENQYRVGNVVKINQTTGTVENMSLRLTVLRDLEGITHFIPHGQILDISNLTHVWSRVMFDIGVSYNENIDEVMDVLKELGSQMNVDPEYGDLILGEMEMLGVNKFSDSAIEIKFLVKTKPLKQWIIKREMLRRIKNRFDELGFEIPYPHLTIYQQESEKQHGSTPCAQEKVVFGENQRNENK